MAICPRGHFSNLLQGSARFCVVATAKKRNTRLSFPPLPCPYTVPLPCNLIAMDYFEEQKFKKLHEQGKGLEKGRYESCTFVECDFGESDLSEIRFSDCRFIECNLSNASLNLCALQEVHFEHCKLLGIRFDECKPLAFGVSFAHCLLDHSSFHALPMQSTRFSHCRLHGVDFAATDLREARFDDCDLRDALFEDTQLQKASFVTASNYIIHPERNKIKEAHFSQSGLHGLLMPYGIKVV